MDFSIGIIIPGYSRTAVESVDSFSESCFRSIFNSFGANDTWRVIWDARNVSSGSPKQSFTNISRAGFFMLFERFRAQRPQAQRFRGAMRRGIAMFFRPAAAKRALSGLLRLSSLEFPRPWGQEHIFLEDV